MAVALYGVWAVSFMMLMYSLEARSRHFIAGFALGCALSSAYGFLAGTWPFGVVEGGLDPGRPPALRHGAPGPAGGVAGVNRGPAVR